MLPSNKQKFNKPKGKTKHFPIKQFRFDVTNSPIFKTKSKASFKIKSLLSQQEQLMLKGLQNSFGVDSSKAFRIALSKVSTIASEELKVFLPRSLAQTKLKGHTARNRKLLISLPREEKESFELFARTQQLTLQAAARLVIIYAMKSIRSGTLTKIEGCKLLTDDQCAEIYFSTNPVSSGKLDALKKARDKGLDEKIERDEYRYNRRGQMIEEIIHQGGYIPTDVNGKIDIGYVDDCIAIEEAELTNKSWELYLEELQRLNSSEEEIKIENEIFHAMRIGIELTHDEAKQIIKEKEYESKEDSKFDAEAWCNQLKEAQDNKDFGQIAQLYAPEGKTLTDDEIEEVIPEYEKFYSTKPAITTKEFFKDKRLKKENQDRRIIESIREQIKETQKELDELNSMDLGKSQLFYGESKDERVKELMNKLDILDGQRYGKYRHLNQRYPEL